jgi:hypothetical protein
MSFQALFERRSAEALQIAQSVLDREPPSPRVRVLFGIREARALAQQGRREDALRAIMRARGLFMEGQDDADPPWVWWIDDAELAFHEADCRACVGDTKRALALAEEAVDDCQPRRINARFVYLAQLLRLAIMDGDWHEAELVILRTIPYVGEVGSTRTMSMLRGSLDRLSSSRADRPVRDAAAYLGERMLVAGHGVA